MNFDYVLALFRPNFLFSGGGCRDLGQGYPEARRSPAGRLRFYVGLFGLYGLLLVPFGFRLEEVMVAPAAVFGGLASGFVFISFLIALYEAVRRSEVAAVAPLVGVLATIFIFFLSFVFLGERLSAVQILSFVFLIAGGTLVSLKSFNPRKYPYDILGWSLLAGFLMAASFVLIKFAYQKTAL